LIRVAAENEIQRNLQRIELSDEPPALFQIPEAVIGEEGEQNFAAKFGAIIARAATSHVLGSTCSKSGEILGGELGKHAYRRVLEESRVVEAQPQSSPMRQIGTEGHQQAGRD
jgi:hypothetical protein